MWVDLTYLRNLIGTSQATALGCSSSGDVRMVQFEAAARSVVQSLMQSHSYDTLSTTLSTSALATPFLQKLVGSLMVRNLYGFRDLYAAALNDNAFRAPLTEISKEPRIGWVDFWNPLGLTFDDLNRIMQNMPQGGGQQDEGPQGAPSLGSAPRSTGQLPVIARGEIDYTSKRRRKRRGLLDPEN